MKKFLVWVGVSLSCMTYVNGDNSSSGANTFTAQSRQVVISTNLATPTNLFQKDSYVQRTWIVNTSTVAIYISTTNVTISSSVHFAIPPTVANTNAIPFTLDGPTAPYMGPIWAAGNQAGEPVTISVLRTK